MPHELPPLPYPFDALEPHIDAKTMEIHHGKHHATYVTKLNAALEKHPDLQRKSIEDLLAGINSVPDEIRGPVRNNGGGHLNHSIFWRSMKKGGGGEPDGALGNAIKGTFGSFDGFKQKLTDAALNRFGSGWSWLCMDQGGRLMVKDYPNQDNPIMDGHKPILGVDVWEHAYYLKYQNRRPDYLAAWWNTINWAEVQDRFAKGGGRG